MTGTASGTGGTVTFTGQISAGSGTAISLNASGAFTATGVMGTRLTSGGNSPFAGIYNVAYTGSESGSATATITQAGAISGTVMSPSVGNVPVSGSSSITGATNMVSSGTVNGTPYTITWTGQFFLTGSTPVGAGTWQSSSGFHGSWVATAG